MTEWPNKHENQVKISQNLVISQ